MKSILKKVTLVLLSVFVFSCSSDDNSSTTVDNGNEEVKTKDVLLVLSMEESEYNIEEGIETLERVTLTKFSYDVQNRLDKTILSVLTGEIQKGDNVGEMQYVYNEKSQLIALQYNGNNEMEFFYENDLLVKSIEDDVDTYVINDFRFDENNRVSEMQVSFVSKEEGAVQTQDAHYIYNYNQMGLITSVHSNKLSDIYSEISYDEEKTLFSDVIFNTQVLNDESLVELGILLYNPKHNIKTVKIDGSLFSSTYELDDKKYPIKEVVLEEDLETGAIIGKSVYIYTYKIITVPVK